MIGVYLADLQERFAHSQHDLQENRGSDVYPLVLSSDAGSSRVTSNFVVYRAKNGKVDTYYGHNLYTLDWSGETWKIASKRVVLDMDMLYPGKISIVL